MPWLQAERRENTMENRAVGAIIKPNVSVQGFILYVKLIMLRG